MLTGALLILSAILFSTRHTQNILHAVHLMLLSTLSAQHFLCPEYSATSTVLLAAVRHARQLLLLER
jgi:hypothetical protein